MLSNLECLAKAHNTKKKYHTLKIIRARLYKARYIYPSSLNVAYWPLKNNCSIMNRKVLYFFES